MLSESARQKSLNKLKEMDDRKTGQLSLSKLDHFVMVRTLALKTLEVLAREKISRGQMATSDSIAVLQAHFLCRVM